MPVCCSAVRTATRSVGSETTSKDSPRLLTSSAPASSTAASTSSSETPSCWGTITTPLRLNRNDTDPGSAIVPPLRVIAVRTSEAARLRLSVRHSTTRATPPGPYPSYMIVWYSAPPASAPEPRLTARSMFSVGTELLRAFWIASYSVGLPSGSPPPVRAATSIFLISFAKSLPRLASTTAFLCLVVAHFEWPLIPALSRLPSLTRMRSPGPHSTAGPSRRRAGARGDRRSAPDEMRWPARTPAGPPRSYRRRGRRLGCRAPWPAPRRQHRPVPPKGPG